MSNNEDAMIELEKFLEHIKEVARNDGAFVVLGESPEGKLCGFTGESHSLEKGKTIKQMNMMVEACAILGMDLDEEDRLSMAAHSFLRIKDGKESEEPLVNTEIKTPPQLRIVT